MYILHTLFHYVKTGKKISKVSSAVILCSKFSGGLTFPEFLTAQQHALLGKNISVVSSIVTLCKHSSSNQGFEVRIRKADAKELACYVVATTFRLLKIIGLKCKRNL